MQLTFVNILAIVLTYLVFGHLGFRLSKRLKRPIAIATWLAVVFGTFIATFVMRGAILIGGGEFNIHFNEALQAIGVGIIIGLATRELRLRLASH